MYRLYIIDCGSRFYLVDVIIADNMEHPQFSVEWSRAMTFPSLAKAMDYRARLITMGYAPHIA